MRTGRNTNRRTKRNESRIFQGGVPVRDWGHSSNQGNKELGSEEEHIESIEIALKALEETIKDN